MTFKSHRCKLCGQGQKRELIHSKYPSWSCPECDHLKRGDSLEKIRLHTDRFSSHLSDKQRESLSQFMYLKLGGAK